MLRNPRCTACSLHLGAKTVCVKGSGSAEAEILVVGQNPGREEDKHGRPFIGSSGKLIRAELAKAGFGTLFAQEKIRFTNMVRCISPNNRPPTPKEIKACKPYLDAEIQAVKPKYILALGGPAAKALAKRSKITTSHGEFVEIDGRTVMPAYHPAFVLRSPDKLPALQNDLARLRRHMDGTLGQQISAFKYRVVETPADLAYFWKAFDPAEFFSLDTETSGLLVQDPKFHVRCVSIGLVDCAWVIPLEMPHSMYAGDHHRAAAFLRVLQKKAEDKTSFMWNGKYDNSALYAAYQIRFRLDLDGMLAHHILDENQDHDLKYVSRVELDCPEYDIPKKEKLNPDLLNFKKRAEYLKYGGRDGWNTTQLGLKFQKKLRANRQLRRLFYKLVMPAARALEEIEREGLTLDLDKYASVEERIKLELQVSEEGLNQQVGRTVNWNSPDQIAQVLFVDFKLPVMAQTPTGKPSTSEAAIVDLKGKHPIVNDLLKYRELDKILGTYLEGWKQYIVHGKLYLGYKQHGTVGGRFSSRLHQIPTEGDIRSIVSAPPGWSFVAADLSQAELRVAAEVSGDLEMVNAYRNGADVHWKTLMFMLQAGRTDAEALSLETARLYCLRHGLPAYGTSCKILQAVWHTNKGQESTEECLKFSKEEYEELRCRERRSTMGKEQPILERGNSATTFTPLDKNLLRTLREYNEFRCASQGLQSSKQCTLQLSDALSLLSSISTQQIYTLSKEWKDWRNKAKRVNFAYLYGMFEKTFMARARVDYDWNCSWDEAHSMRTAFFELYQGIPDWHERCKRLVRIDGQVTNMFGRIRRLPAIYSTDKMTRMEAERQAINIGVQSTIGDWKTAALVEIHETVDRNTFRLVGEHHDALLGIVKTGWEDEVLPKVRQIMTRPQLFDDFNIEMKVPMAVDIALGPWGAGTPYVGDV